MSAFILGALLLVFGGIVKSYVDRARATAALARSVSGPIAALGSGKKARFRLVDRPEVEAAFDNSERWGFSLWVKVDGIRISASTTLWIERRRHTPRTAHDTFLTGMGTFDANYVVGGDGLEFARDALCRPDVLEAIDGAFRGGASVVSLNADGQLVVRKQTPRIDQSELRAMMEVTTELGKALDIAVAALPRARGSDVEASAVGGESGAPVPVPIKRG